MHGILGRLSDSYIPDTDTGTDSHPRMFSSERSLIRFEAPVSESLSPNMLLLLNTGVFYPADKVFPVAVFYFIFTHNVSIQTLAGSASVLLLV